MTGVGETFSNQCRIVKVYSFLTPGGKVVVVGDGAVGKTCLLSVYCDNVFPDGYIPTLMEQKSKEVKVDGKTVSLQLYDTAGQEDYDRLRPLAYTGADVIFICFSASSPQSLENIEVKWAPEVKSLAPNATIFLIMTRSDEPHESVNYEQMKSKIGAEQAFETSSKERIGVEKPFEAAALAITRKYTKKRICSVV